MIWAISFNFIIYILHFATSTTSCTIQVQLLRDNRAHKDTHSIRQSFAL